MLSSLWSAEALFYLLLFIYLPACLGLIVVVLFQKGKGVGFAGAFGVGPGSDAVFGPRAGKNLLHRLTHIMAALFMILALGMSMVSGHLGKGAAPALEPEIAAEAEAPVETAPAAAPDLTNEAPATAPETVPDLIGESAPAAETVPETAAPAEEIAPEVAPQTETPAAETAPEAAPVPETPADEAAPAQPEQSENGQSENQ